MKKKEDVVTTVVSGFQDRPMHFVNSQSVTFFSSYSQASFL